MTSDKNRSQDENRRQLRNEDPISGERGAHPMGAGTGAAIGGAAMGAAAGSLAGPLGTVAGTVVGGIAGALAGKAIAENVNPTIETSYWRETYLTRPYYTDEYSFEEYLPAYQLGWESYTDEDRDWTTIEPELGKKWHENRWENEGGAPPMSWEDARLAAKDSYERVATREIKTRNSDDDRRPNKPR